MLYLKFKFPNQKDLFVSRGNVIFCGVARSVPGFQAGGAIKIFYTASF